MQHQDQVDGLSNLDMIWLLEPLLPDMSRHMLQLLGEGNVCAELSFGISKLLHDLYSKVRGKGRLSAAESSVLVTR